MCVGPKRNAKGSSETEICELEVTVLVDEEVLGFEISMEDSMSVTVVESLDELEGETLFEVGTKKTRMSFRRTEGRVGGKRSARKQRRREGKEGERRRMLNEP